MELPRFGDPFGNRLPGFERDALARIFTSRGYPVGDRALLVEVSPVPVGVAKTVIVRLRRYSGEPVPTIDYPDDAVIYAELSETGGMDETPMLVGRGEYRGLGACELAQAEYETLFGLFQAVIAGVAALNTDLPGWETPFDAPGHYTALCVL